MIVEVRTTGWSPVQGEGPPAIENFARTQVVVTFPHRRSTPTGATPRTKEVVLIEERGELLPSASDVEKGAEEQRIVDLVMVRVQALCERKQYIPPGGKKPIPLGDDEDRNRFVLLDAEPADFRPHKILDPTETHWGLPNENLRKKFLPPKIWRHFESS